MRVKRGSAGPCCRCGTTRNVVAICMLDRRAPVPGKGWGCVLCDLPPDGAVAVFCDACAELPIDDQDPQLMVCVGFPGDGQRMPITDLPPGVFAHDNSVSH